MAAEPTDQAERADVALNRLDLIQRWSDDLAHEIKNPFHSMVINLELVKRRGGDADAVGERAEVVESELHRVHDLIDSILRMVRPWPDTGSANADTVYEALLPAVKARAARRSIDCVHEPGAGTVPLPPAHVALLLLNLVDNAIDALPEEGRLVTRFTRDDDGAWLRVIDNGPGVADLEGDPFERGVTSREGRSGLGLAVCRRLVEGAGGSITLEPVGAEKGVTAAARLP